MLLTELQLDILPPQAVMLAADVVLLSIPEGERTAHSLPLGIEPPYGSVLVQNLTGRFQIVATRYRDREGDDDDLALDRPHPAGGPFALGADLDELVGDLDDASRWRLLNFLLGFCRKAFDLSEDEEFAATCLHLAKVCAREAGIAHPIASAGRTWTVLRGPQIAPDASCFILGPRRVYRTRVVPLSDLKDYSAAERINGGNMLLVVSEQAERWTLGPPPQSMKDLIQPQPDLALLRIACLRALVSVCPIVAASLRERLLLSPAAPIRHDDPRQPIGGALDATLSDGEGRLFLRGWLRDPIHLVQAIALATPCGDLTVAPDTLFHHRRPDIEKRFAASPFAKGDCLWGFVAHLDDPSAGSCPQPTLELRLHSGTRMTLRSPLRCPEPAAARAAVLASVSPADVTDPMLDGCLGPAAAAFHRRALEGAPVSAVLEIGQQPKNPQTSIIVPLYRNLGFIRFQIAALAADPECQAAELIVVLDSPEQRHEVEHLVRGLHAMHGRPVRLVILSRNLGYAAANNTGARHARGRTLLLLNSDVVPSKAGWLSTLQAALAGPDVSAVGPKLLFDDESIQHAGLYFRRDRDGMWLNAHYHKGMPRRWSGAAGAREVPGVTGAALLVHRDLFDAVGGICHDYIIGDYEDSDFCLRLRAQGTRILYVPSAELYHFERKSIELHKGYSGTLACAYNRRLHHRRWDSAIEALMERPEFQLPGLGVAA